MSTTTPYDSVFYGNQMPGSLSSAKEILPFVFKLIKPESVIDVGCGLGTWLFVCSEHSVKDLMGIDGSYVDRKALLIPEEKFITYDLSKKINIQRHFDLVISLEVAEHLPSTSAQDFIDSLVSLGDVILFASAIPNQGGRDHVNEQWPEYWENLFEERDYCLVDCLRHRFWNNSKVKVCYRQNIFFYVKNDYLKKNNTLMMEKEKSKNLLLSVVHPNLFLDRLAEPPTLRPLLRAFPYALMLAIRKRVEWVTKRF